jgi:AcrR family transcriptional regulator
MQDVSKIPGVGASLAKSRRRQIFLAVTRVLARKSFHQATVKEMAQEAGIAAGSIYQYLRSKDEIVLLLVESMVDELVEELPGIRERTQDDPRAEAHSAGRGRSVSRSLRGDQSRGALLREKY